MEQTSFKQLIDALSHKTQSIQTTDLTKYLPLSDEQCIELLEKNYLIEVYKRGSELSKDEILTQIVKDKIRKIRRIVIGSSRRKGLLFGGGVGNGKTTLALAIFDTIQPFIKTTEYEGKYGLPPLRWVSALDILNRAKDEYNGNGTEFTKLINTRYLFIDDLGTEEVEVKSFGNSKMPLIELLLKRYEMRSFTVITTNDDLPTLAIKYTERISDRIKEMFAVMAFNEKSYRK